MPPVSRPPIPYKVQVAVFRRDKWLCHTCRRPVIFGLALRQLADLVETTVADETPAYYDNNWRRDLSPLLDDLGASIDHVEAYGTGGKHSIDNFATICAKCNARKGSKAYLEYIAEMNYKAVKGKYGEPKTWDGMTSVFIALASRAARPLTATEKNWFNALKQPAMTS